MAQQPTKKDLAEVLNLLVDAYPHVEVNRGTIKLYAMRLAHFDLDDLRMAVLYHIDNSRYFPSIAEIKALTEKARKESWLHQKQLSQPDYAKQLVAGWQVCPMCEERTPSLTNCPYCADLRRMGVFDQVYQDYLQKKPEEALMVMSST